MRQFMSLLVLGVLGLVVPGLGCQQKAAEKVAQPQPQPPPQQPPLVQQPGQKPPLSAIARRLDRPQRLHELKQIGTFYQLWNTERGRPPADLKAFVASFQRDAPALSQAILEGYYMVVPNVRTGSGVVAYEKEADINGQHGFVRGDTSVDVMTSQQLQAALKGQ